MEWNQKESYSVIEKSITGLLELTSSLSDIINRGLISRQAIPWGDIRKRLAQISYRLSLFRYAGGNKIGGSSSLDLYKLSRCLHDDNFKKLAIWPSSVVNSDLEQSLLFSLFLV